MTTLSIRIDDNVKQQASELYKELGLDLSTAVNIFLRQSIMRGGLPFDVVKEVPNAVTLAAMNEYKEMTKHPERYKRYTDLDEMWADIDAEDADND